MFSYAHEPLYFSANFHYYVKWIPKLLKTVPFSLHYLSPFPHKAGLYLVSPVVTIRYWCGKHAGAGILIIIASHDKLLYIQIRCGEPRTENTAMCSD